MRAVIYSRISRDEQSKYSLGEQTEKCREHMEREGHEIVDIFVDDGYSSKTMNRPALQDMLSQIKSNKFDIICVWNSDRLTRTTLDGLVMVTTMFRPNGIDFASVTEEIDTSTPDGMMMFTIRLSMAQREREKIAERSSMGQIGRAKQGKRNSSAKPYGYEVGEDLVLTILEYEATVVKQIFEWFIEGYGKNKICSILNKSGISPPRGGQYWLEPTIKAIIINPTFYGANHYKPKNGARIIVENMHEAIISKDTYIHANEIMKRKRENLMNRSSYEFPFSTVVKCGLCGRSYHGSMKSVGKLKEKYPKIIEKEYYRCAGYYRQNGCDASSIMEYKLVKLIFDTIRNFDIEEIDRNETADKPSPNIAKERKRLTKEIEKSKERLMKLAKAMSSGDLDFDIYTKLRTEEKEKVDKWEQMLSELPNDDINITSKRMGEVADEIRNLKKDWSSWSRMKRKQMIQKMFKRIVINKINGEWKIEEFEMNA